MIMSVETYCTLNLEKQNKEKKKEKSQLSFRLALSKCHFIQHEPCFPVLALNPQALA